MCPHCKKKNFAGHASVSNYVKYGLEHKLSNPYTLTLLCWNCKDGIRCELEESKDYAETFYNKIRNEWVKPKNEEITDAIYCSYNSKEMKALQERFPEAIFNDASDYVHNNRFEIILKDVSVKDYIKAMVQEGLLEVSLYLQLRLRMNKEYKDIFREVLEELKAEHDPCIRKEYWT